MKKSVFLLIYLCMIIPAAWTEIYPKPVLNLHPVWGSFISGSSYHDDAEMESGSGFILGLGISSLAVKNSYLQCTGGFEFINHNSAEIQYYNRTFLAVAAGCTFPLLDHFTITPLAGGEVLLHITDIQVQWDAGLDLSALFSVHLTDLYHIFLSVDFSFLTDREVASRLTLGVKNNRILIPRIPPGNTAALQVSPEVFQPGAGDNAKPAEFHITVSGENAISSWRLAIRDTGGNPVMNFSGRGTPPAKVDWDGFSKQGQLVLPDTEYPVYLEVVDDLNRKTGAEALVKTGSIFFVLPEPEEKLAHSSTPEPEVPSPGPDLPTPAPDPDTVEPDLPVPELDRPAVSRVELAVKPDLFSPDADGYHDSAEILIKITGANKIVSWFLEISDPHDNYFTSFSGKGFPPGEITWNGYSKSGELVSSAMEYPVHLAITDELGRQSRTGGMIVTDILVIRAGDRFKVKIPDITFAPGDTDLIIGDDLDTTVKNLQIIQRLYEIFLKFEAYNIHIEGHANNLSWYDPVEKELEEETILKPLSLQRAETVRNSLINMGIASERISVAGLGGSRPIVPFSDQVNRWKNRRVEIILDKRP